MNSGGDQVPPPPYHFVGRPTYTNLCPEQNRSFVPKFKSPFHAAEHCFNVCFEILASELELQYFEDVLASHQGRL
jgi:hypothetical protein